MTAPQCSQPKYGAFFRPETDDGAGHSPGRGVSVPHFAAGASSQGLGCPHQIDRGLQREATLVAGSWARQGCHRVS